MQVAIQLVPDECLSHHGILGQTWGEKQGPPYPLGGSNHSASEKKAGWWKSLDKNGSDNQNGTKKKGLSEKRKKQIKIGIAIVGTALAAYGGYKLVKSRKIDGLVNIGKKNVESVLNKKVGDIDLKKDTSVKLPENATSKMVDNIVSEASGKIVNGLKTLTKPEKISEIISKANPNRGDPKYHDNCTASSMASFLRSIGFDVVAKPTGGTKWLKDVVKESFKNARILSDVEQGATFAKSPDAAAGMLVRKFGNNASGVVSVQLTSGKGHAFNWKITDGVVEFFDGKVNKDDSYIRARYWGQIAKSGLMTIARLDNADIDFDGIKKYVE